MVVRRRKGTITLGATERRTEVGCVGITGSNMSSVTLLVIPLQVVLSAEDAGAGASEAFVQLPKKKRNGMEMKKMESIHAQTLTM